MKTKIITLLTALAIVVTLDSCAKKKGCMDKDSTNYDSSAEKDDGSCEYSSSYVFWAPSGSLSGGASYNIYLNGVLQGNIGVTFASPPTCGTTGALTVVKNLGGNKTQSFELTISYDSAGFNGPQVSAGTINFNANTCTSEEL